jgi:hypothetical protein
MKQTAYFTAVLALAGLTIAFAPVSVPSSARFDEPDITGSIAAIAKVLTEAGRLLTCEQIRLMDEVELITDDSYCE